MLDINIIFAILFVHWVSDFLLQSNWMAQNKSKSLLALTTHTVVYAIPMTLFGGLFALINGVLHFVIDFITSRITSYLWAKKEVHYFFVVIGLDQLLHAICLIYTYYLLQ